MAYFSCDHCHIAAGAEESARRALSLGARPHRDSGSSEFGKQMNRDTVICEWVNRTWICIFVLYHITVHTVASPLHRIQVLFQVPEGIVQIRGTVASTKFIESKSGNGTSRYQNRALISPSIRTSSHMGPPNTPLSYSLCLSLCRRQQPRLLSTRNWDGALVATPNLLHPEVAGVLPPLPSTTWGT
jgi:hypothetical protein